jgi:hypothetical protein
MALQRREFLVHAGALAMVPALVRWLLASAAAASPKLAEKLAVDEPQVGVPLSFRIKEWGRLAPDGCVIGSSNAEATEVVYIGINSSWRSSWR